MCKYEHSSETSREWSQSQAQMLGERAGSIQRLIKLKETHKSKASNGQNQKTRIQEGKKLKSNNPDKLQKAEL